jgi:hypothetical protein
VHVNALHLFEYEANSSTCGLSTIGIELKQVSGNFPR